MKKFVVLLVMAGLIISPFAFAKTQGGSKKFTGNDWLSLPKQERLELVASFIQAGKRKGITIKKEPVFYAERLDAFYEEHPNLKSETVGKILKTVMIMEYDWTEKGVDKDVLAKQWLGDELYKKNKERLKTKK